MPTRAFLAALFLCLSVTTGGAAERGTVVIQTLVEQHARAAGVPVSLAVALVKVESRFDKWATGAAGEIGLGQIKCESARYFGFDGKCKELYHVSINLRYTMAYLAKALKLSGGNQCGALSRYNGGLFFKGKKKGYCAKVAAEMK